MSRALFRIGACLVAVACCVTAASAQTPAGTAFTYQGLLKDSGVPLNSSGVQMRFELYDVASGGTALASVSATVPVTKGQFTTTLDFGAAAVSQDARWLQVAVYKAETGWVNLTPRQRLTPAPQAVTAQQAAALNLPYVGGLELDSDLFTLQGSGAEGGRTLVVEHTGNECTAINASASGTDSGAIQVTASGTNGVGLYASATGSGGNAIVGYTSTNAGHAGMFTSMGLSSIALQAVAYGASGRGVYGRAASATGINYGIYGESSSSHGYGGYFMGRGYFSGNLGVGVANPVQKLDVAGTIQTTGFKLTTSPAAGYVLTSDASGVGTWQPAPGGGSTLWLTNGSDIYYSNGWVGIGMSAPDAPLDIAGGNWDLANTEGDLRIGTATYRLKFGTATSGAGAGLMRIRAVGGTPKIALGAGTADVLTVTATNAGVGTLTPDSASKFDVAGKLRATTLQVTSGATAGHVLTADASGNATWQAATGGISLPYSNSLSSGASGFTITNSSAGSGLKGVGGNRGVEGEGTFNGVYGWSASGNGVAGSSNTGIGVKATSSGTGTDGPALYAQNTNAAGVAIVSTVSSTDANTVVINRGSGDLIKGFSGSMGENMVFRVTNTGRTEVSVLTITGGSDLSEQFDIKAGDLSLEPGMVVCIDPDDPGELVVASRAYDRTVAGVISGAGGVATGMTLGHRGTVADGAHPVALTGRVYVWVDASHGPVVPGDLLTTSPTPGHAMKVQDHGQAPGAVLGKAMSRLDSGRGLVLVLVSLQ
jgi:hypothetical protein